jgi:hypothetical protein
VVGTPALGAAVPAVPARLVTAAAPVADLVGAAREAP